MTVPGGKSEGRKSSPPTHADNSRLTPRARRDAAVEKVAMMITDLWHEHVAACGLKDCAAKDRMEDALRALYSLRKREP